MDVISKINISKDERQELAAIVGCSQNQLETNLANYASAALAEYVTMMLGQKVFRRGSDILEYRLFLLITKAFGNKIPDEQNVCRIFQVSSSESRSLIRSVMSKFQYQLKKAITESMKKIVESATTPGNGQPYVATIHNKNLVDSLNVKLAEIDGSLQPVVKKRGSVSDFEFSPASYQALSEILEVQ